MLIEKVDISVPRVSDADLHPIPCDLPVNDAGLRRKAPSVTRRSAGSMHEINMVKCIDR